MTGGKVFLAAVLCSFILGSTESASCCLRYTRRPLPCKILLGYSIQSITGSCDINAIIFHIPGRFVCADPTLAWTQRRKTCVDERNRKGAQILTKAASGNVAPSLFNTSNPQTSV